jgi:hypothetical protein
LTKGPDGFPVLDKVPLQDTWIAMENLVKEGLVKSIGLYILYIYISLGLSSFPPVLVYDLLSYAKIKPGVIIIVIINITCSCCSI